MAKVRYLTDLGWPGEIHLVYAVKTERDIIFRASSTTCGGGSPTSESA